MRILLTGAGGQLGQAFQEVIAGRHALVLGYHAGGTAIAGGVAMDLERPETLGAVVREARPDCIVHGGSMTNVDLCEKEPARAMVVNGDATGVLARSAREIGARFVYVSTDYVFDGEAGPYKEDAPTHAISHYGASKLRGEVLARENHPHAAVGRTSVVFGPHKNNFVRWVIQELRAGNRIKIVEDQWVSPTLTYDLSHQLVALVEAKATGVYHTAGGERLSRLEMAKRIAKVFGLDAGLIDPIKSKDLNWLAKRPRDSSLDVSKVSRVRRPMDFNAALELLKRKLPS